MSNTMAERDAARLDEIAREAARRQLRSDRVHEALEHARARRGSGNVGPRYLDQLLRYLEAAEDRCLAERQLRQTFEREAEGEFLEKRLELRATRAYAVLLEQRRDALAAQLFELLDTLQRIRNVRWWRWRERRWLRGQLLDDRTVAAAVLSRDEPTPPAVEAE